MARMMIDKKVSKEEILKSFVDQCRNVLAGLRANSLPAAVEQMHKLVQLEHLSDAESTRLERQLTAKLNRARTLFDQEIANAVENVTKRLQKVASDELPGINVRLDRLELRGRVSPQPRHP